MPWRFNQLAGAGLRLRRNQLGLSLDEVAKKAGGDTNKWAVKRWESEVNLTEHRTEIQLGYGYFSEQIVGTPLLDDAYKRCKHDIATIASLERGFPRLSGAKTSIKIGLAAETVHAARIEPVVITLDPQAATGERPESHCGEEIIYVIAGSLVIEHQAADKDGHVTRLRLAEGSLAHLRSEVPHRIVNPGPGSSTILVVKHPPDRYSRCTLEAVCTDIHGVPTAETGAKAVGSKQDREP